MNKRSQKIEYLRERIPSFKCTPGCHDWCGPVTTSSEEMARLPIKSEAAHATALADLSCPHLGENGCLVYDERPLICRLFGTTPNLACPNGCRPEQMVDAEIEQAGSRLYCEDATGAGLRQRPIVDAAGF